MTETKEIVTAICAAMGQVQKVTKDGRNKHDGYNFASIDDFLALVNPICAANGLLVHMQEGAREDFERQGRSGTSAWMRQSFDLTLMHVSGQSLPPVTRTVEVLRNGAQAYGSAQSYALKQFWRCILLIPTGDKDDADYAPTDAGTITSQPRRDDRRYQEPASRQDTKPDDATRLHSEAIANAKTGKELLEAVKASGDFATSPTGHSAIVNALRPIVKGAQTIDSLRKLAEVFAPVWPQVELDASMRETELNMANPYTGAK
jgi:hypothetical protein